MRGTALVFPCLLAWSMPLTFAAIHHSFIGSSKTPSAIYSLGYDDVANSLTLLNTNEADAVHPYLAFNVRDFDDQHCDTC
jgi:hypothetical protein